MSKQRQATSIDGFTVRRRDTQGMVSGSKKLGTGNLAVPGHFLRNGSEIADQPKNAAHLAPAKHVPGMLQRNELPEPVVEEEKTLSSLSRSEIDQSLDAIDQTPSKPKRKRRFRLSKKKVALFVVALFLITGLYFGVKILLNSSKVFSGNIFDLLGQGAVLKADEDGRTNILVFGTSEDDPSHRDAGGDLTDSIMILSLDQKNKNAAMISVPRDLWVKYGEGCSNGYEGKINAVYQCGAENGSESDGARMLMDIVGESFGFEMHYYAHVNYTVVRDTVNAVGGVDITIDSDDPRGILDRNFDWACRMQCYYVKWPNGPAHLDGDHALALARARNAAGGYGLGGGNFDREQYQQKILVALKKKAASAGTLANPVAVSNILDALGNNVRTSFNAGEVKTLMNLANELPDSSIKSISLVETGKAVVTTGNVNGQSTVIPKAGTYDFSDIQSYIRSKLPKANGEIGESAQIEVLNGSDMGGLAGKKASQLEEAGLENVSTGDTPTSAAYGDFVWYDLSDGKAPKTLTKLKTVLGKEAAGTTLPTGVQSDADFVIIVGNGVN